MKIPDFYRLEKITKFSDVTELLSNTRLMVPWGAVGLGMALYDKMSEYVCNRKQFGKSLASYQLIQKKLVEVMANVQIAIVIASQITRIHYDGGGASYGKIAFGKAVCTKVVREAAGIAREALGGNGV